MHLRSQTLVYVLEIDPILRLIGGCATTYTCHRGKSINEPALALRLEKQVLGWEKTFTLRK
jgi:hypothetical protein